MTQPRRDQQDERIENLLGNLLRAGVLTAAVVVLTGGVVYLADHGGEPAETQVFHGAPASLRSPHAILTNALAGRGRGIIQLGLLLLIATPVLRVAFAVVGFAWQRDFLYVSLTLFVLAVLLLSLFYGNR